MQPQEASLTVNEQVWASPAPSPPRPATGRAKGWGVGVQRQPEPHFVGGKTTLRLPHAPHQPVCPHAWACRGSAPSFGAWLPHPGVFLMMKRRRKVLVLAARRSCGCRWQEVFALGFGCLPPPESWRRSQPLCLSVPGCPQVNVTRGKAYRDSEGSPDPGSEPLGGSACSSAADTALPGVLRPPLAVFYLLKTPHAELGLSEPRSC